MPTSKRPSRTSATVKRQCAVIVKAASPHVRSGCSIINSGKSSPPMKRPAQPEERAPAYVFLAAPSCASYISGAVLPVMGGPSG